MRKRGSIERGEGIPHDLNDSSVAAFKGIFVMVKGTHHAPAPVSGP